MPRQLTVLVFAALLAVPLVCDGATVYVARNGDGSDPHSGREAEAFGSIAGAVRAAEEGDTIEVFPGDYSVEVMLDSGVKLLGREPRPVLRAKNSPVVRLASGSTLDHFRLVGAPREAVVYCSRRAKGVTVRGCIIEGGRRGIVAAASSGLSVTKCEVRRNLDAGLKLTGRPGEPNRIAACTIYRNGRHGVVLRDGGDWLIDGCTIAFNVADGISIDRCSPKLRNCIISNNSRYGIFEGPLNCRPIVVCNVLRGNSAGFYSRASKSSPESLAELNSLRAGCRGNTDIDPRFVCVRPGEEDFRLLPGSPAYTAGHVGARAGAAEMLEEEPPEPQEPWRVTVIDALTLIPQEVGWFDAPARKEARVEVARGETGAFQIAAVPMDEGVKTWRVAVSPLVNAAGDEEIEARVSYVGYLRRTHDGSGGRISRWLMTKGGNRWQPDVLMSQPPRARPGAVQAAWIGVSVPHTVVPGDYHGKAVVSAPGASREEIKIRLRVFRFGIPVRTTLPTVFDYSVAALRDRYGDGTADRREWLYDDMLKHRMAPLLYLDTKSEEFEEDAREHIGGGAPMFAIRCDEMISGWPRSDEHLAEIQKKYKASASKLSELGLLEDACIRPWLKVSMFDSVLKPVGEMLQGAGPGVRRLVVLDGVFAPERVPGLLDAGDIWCSEPLTTFRRGTVEAVHEAGRRVWMAVSDFERRRPGLTLDDDPVDWVMLPWLAWANSIDGLFCWNANAWGTNSCPLDITRFIGGGTDEPPTLRSFNLFGVLYYPSETVPLRSIRLEVFRSGLQDYERLALLAHRVSRARRAGVRPGLVAEGEELLSRAKELAPHPARFPRDARAVLQLRREIGRCLEKFEPRQ